MSTIGPVRFGTPARLLATAQPGVYCEGASGRVDALGSYCAACSTLTYQWNEGEVPIPGATGVAYDIPSSQSPDRYDYTVEIACAANADRSNTSNVAAVEIVQRPGEVSPTSVVDKVEGGSGLEFHWADSPGASDYVVAGRNAVCGAGPL